MPLFSPTATATRRLIVAPMIRRLQLPQQQLLQPQQAGRHVRALWATRPATTSTPATTKTSGSAALVPVSSGSSNTRQQQLVTAPLASWTTRTASIINTMTTNCIGGSSGRRHGCCCFHTTTIAQQSSTTTMDGGKTTTTSTSEASVATGNDDTEENTTMDVANSDSNKSKVGVLELSELVAAECPGLSKKKVASVIRALIKSITSSLLDGKTVTISKLGQWDVRVRAERTYTNLQDPTGPRVTSPESKVVHFKVSKVLRSYVRGDRSFADDLLAEQGGEGETTEGGEGEKRKEKKRKADKEKNDPSE